MSSNRVSPVDESKRQDCTDSHHDAPETMDKLLSGDKSEYEPKFRDGKPDRNTLGRVKHSDILGFDEAATEHTTVSAKAVDETVLSLSPITALLDVTLDKKREMLVKDILERRENLDLVLKAMRNEPSRDRDIVGKGIFNYKPIRQRTKERRDRHEHFRGEPKAEIQSLSHRSSVNQSSSIFEPKPQDDTSFVGHDPSDNKLSTLETGDVTTRDTTSPPAGANHETPSTPRDPIPALVKVTSESPTQLRAPMDQLREAFDIQYNNLHERVINCETEIDNKVKANTKAIKTLEERLRLLEGSQGENSTTPDDEISSSETVEERLGKLERFVHERCNAYDDQLVNLNRSRDSRHEEMHSKINANEVAIDTLKAAYAEHEELIRSLAKAMSDDSMCRAKRAHDRTLTGRVEKCVGKAKKILEIPKRLRSSYRFYHNFGKSQEDQASRPPSLAPPSSPNDIQPQNRISCGLDWAKSWIGRTSGGRE